MQHNKQSVIVKGCALSLAGVGLLVNLFGGNEQTMVGGLLMAAIAMGLALFLSWLLTDSKLVNWWR